MSNNTTSTVPCSVSESTLYTLNFIFYFIECPICFIFGFPGQIIGSVACFRESRKTITYMYQAMVMISNCINMSLAFIFVLTRIGCGFIGSGFDWFMENYPLMWYSAHLAAPLVNVFSLVQLLMLVAASVDRLLTFLKPYTHGGFQHRKLQKIYISVGLVIGFSASIFDIWRYDLKTENGKYKMFSNTNYTTTPTAVACLHIRNGIIVSAMVALVFSNAASMLLFTHQNKNQNAAIQNDKRLAMKKEAATVLLLLTVSQSLAAIMKKSVSVGYYYATYSMPTFAICGGKVVAPVMDAIGFMYWVVDFYVTIVISRPFRKMVWKTVLWGSTVVKPSQNILVKTS